MSETNVWKRANGRDKKSGDQNRNNLNKGRGGGRGRGRIRSAEQRVVQAVIEPPVVVQAVVESPVVQPVVEQPPVVQPVVEIKPKLTWKSVITRVPENKKPVDDVKDNSQVQTEVKIIQTEVKDLVVQRDLSPVGTFIPIHLHPQFIKYDAIIPEILEVEKSRRNDQVFWDLKYANEIDDDFDDDLED